MISWLYLLAGLGLLYIGAQVLLKGGAGLALRLGLNPLLVGLTIMAYGTSSPELVVSVNASMQGNGSIALGNVVGSNICNIALILGLCSLVTPLSASAQIIRREIPVMIGVTAGFILMLLDGVVARWEGALLLAGVVAYTWHTVVLARRDTAAAKAAEAEAEYAQDLPPAPPALGPAVGMIVGGLALLIGGSHAFVTGAVALAKLWGVSDLVIGLTVVAVGTSMPELASSLVAAVRKHGDVAIGNVVGSNIFNVLGIVGVAALLHPLDASGLSWVDLGIMFALAAALLPVARSGGRVNRWEGLVLLLVFVAYTAWLITSQSGG